MEASLGEKEQHPKEPASDSCSEPWSSSGTLGVCPRSGMWQMQPSSRTGEMWSSSSMVGMHYSTFVSCFCRGRTGDKGEDVTQLTMTGDAWGRIRLGDTQPLTPCTSASLKGGSCSRGPVSHQQALSAGCCHPHTHLLCLLSALPEVKTQRTPDPIHLGTSVTCKVENGTSVLILAPSSILSRKSAMQAVV